MKGQREIGRKSEEEGKEVSIGHTLASSMSVMGRSGARQGKKRGAGIHSLAHVTADLVLLRVPFLDATSIGALVAFSDTVRMSPGHASRGHDRVGREC